MLLRTFPFLVPFTLALRNMSTRRWRTLLTATGIILGVAVVLAIQITNESTLDSIRQVFDRAAGKANLLVVPGSQVQQGMEDYLLDEARASSDVEIAAPSVRVNTVLMREASSFQLNFSITGLASGSMLQLFGVDPALDPDVRVYEIAAGRMPETDRYEVILPQKYAGDQGLEIGDDLVILSSQGSARLEIVGLLAEDGVALLNDGVVAFAPLEVVQDLFERQGRLDEIALKVNSAAGSSPRLLEAIKNSVAESLGSEAQVIYPAARGQLVPQMLSTYQQGLSFFSLIAVFVGAFLIYNTFSMTVVERTREIGMLRAIGMGRFQVIRLVLAEAGMLSIAGSLLGLGVGLVMARGLMALMGAVVSGEQNILTIPAIGVVQSLLVGVGVTFAAALLPAVKAARISPLEALRVRVHSGDKVHSWVWISGLALIFLGWMAIYLLRWREEILFFVGTSAVLAILLGATLTVPLIVAALEGFTRPVANFIYNNEGSIGSSNVRRSVGRTTLTVASLMVALTMVIGIGSLAYSFEQDINAWIDTALGGDLYVRAPIPMRESFGRQLANVPGVAAVTPARYVTVRLSSSAHPGDLAREEPLFFNAIDPETYRQVGDIEFASGQGDPEENWTSLANGDGVFISTTVADRYHLRRGDRLVVLTHRGEHAFTVIAEIVDFTGQGGVVMGTYDDLHRWFADRGVDRYTIKIAPGHTVEQVAGEVEARFGDQRHVNTQTTEVFKGKIRALMVQSFRLFDVLNLIGVVIGALGVINTLTMNVLERQREIGGLRSLGMTRGQVLRMILAESLAMGVIGGVYGLGFGYVIAHILIKGMNLMNGYELVYLFTASPFLIGILIAIFVSQVAALYPARGAASVNIVEAIKHE